MKTFLEYLNDNKKVYKYTIKIATPVMTSDMKNVVESALSKYDLQAISAYKETPYQQNPLDFPNYNNTKVFITEIQLAYPGTSDFLRKYISAALGIVEGQIAVYSENDPRIDITREYLERNDPDNKPEAHLGKEMEFAEEPKYGEQYNTGFLKELADTAAKRRKDEVTNDLIPAQKIDTETVTGEEKSPQNNKPVIGIQPKIEKYFFKDE